MSDIFREVDEDVRAQEYLRLWKTYGIYVIAGLVAIVAGTAGSVAWRTYQTNKLRAEGDKYAVAAAEMQAGKYSEAATALGKIGEDGTKGYSVVARLQQADALSQAGKTDEAIKVYDAVAADSSYSKVLRDLASLSSVMQQMDTGDPEKLLGRLDALNTEDNPWRYSAQELLAALALRTNDTQTAQNLFKTLAEDATAPSSIRSRAREMLSAMGAKS